MLTKFFIDGLHTVPLLMRLKMEPSSYRGPHSGQPKKTQISSFRKLKIFQPKMQDKQTSLVRVSIFLPENYLIVFQATASQTCLVFFKAK